ncbi:MAG TPA: hypothetical protein VHH11_11550 [Gammaproteobacteria bacterium]|nr:hypothetical protein [Gammaproteobacteria bacterium]
MSARIVCVCLLLAANAGLAAKPTPDHSHFVTSDHCIACHTNLRTASGDDVSIGFNWRATMMANSARDPYWHAGVRREVTDHPTAQAAIEDKCSTCHMPMARFDAAAAGRRGEVFANLPAAEHPLAADGVSCTVCHQITAEGLGQEESFDGGFRITTDAVQRHVFGPYEVEPGKASVMRSAADFTPGAGTHIQQSELCATCHTLYTAALNDAGEQIGSLPEQVPYQEWLHSEFRQTRSCQSCHMPVVGADMPISAILGQPRPHFSQHTFRGGNSFMLGLLNKYRDELGVKALSQELDTAIAETKAYLGTQSATLAIAGTKLTGARLDIDLAVGSLSGHKLPTAYPARRVWLHVVVTDERGSVLFESGAQRADGAIVGNDNDADPTRFEPHYDEITSADQVQIYESVMADQQGKVTTGLLRGVRFIKDNRLLPRGFDKSTASAEVAVHGEAERDANFLAGGDHVRYRLDLGRKPAGAVRVSAELMYQSIGYRWAENLRAYDAPETQRFVRYYSDSIAGTAVRLAHAAAEVR